MPKTKARKRSGNTTARAPQRAQAGNHAEARRGTVTMKQETELTQAASHHSSGARLRTSTAKKAGVETLVMPGMVALGCWGLAISFSLFSTDPNHILFAGIAAIMGLIWLFIIRSRIVEMRRSVRK